MLYMSYDPYYILSATAPHEKGCLTTIENWLQLTNSKMVFLWKHVKENKYKPLFVGVELLQANPEYTYI